jgi:hypothetical protein
VGCFVGCLVGCLVGCVLGGWAGGLVGKGWWVQVGSGVGVGFLMG